MGSAQGFDDGGELWSPRSAASISTISSVPSGVTFDAGVAEDDILFTDFFALEVCQPYPPPIAQGQPPSLCQGFVGEFDVENADIAFGDVDDDGYRDYLVGGIEWPDGGAGLDVLLSDPPDPLSPPPGGQGLPGLQLHQIALGNLNLDEYDDLFVFREDGPWEAWVNVCGPGPP